jgi:signal transduction histidine kinase/CheY-like chemotaxis protein
MRLATKLLLSINIILLVVFGIAFYASYSQERAASLRRLADDAMLVGQASATSARRILDDSRHERERLQEWCEAFGALETIRWVEVFDRDAKVIAHTLSERVGKPPLAAHDAIVRRVLQDGEIVDEEDVDGGRLNRFVPVYQGNEGESEIIGVVEVIAALDAANPYGEVVTVGQLAQAGAKAMLDRLESLDSELQAMTEQIGQFNDVIWVEVFDRDATVRAHTKADRVGGKPLAAHQRFILDIYDQPREISEYDPAGGRFNHFLPVMRDGVVESVIEVVLTTASMKERLGRIAWQLGTILGATMLVLSAGFAWMTRRFISRPLDQLFEATTRIAEGQLDHRVELRTSDEFEHLGDTFNSMMESVQEYNASKELAQAKADFLATISHEIRTPMNGILGMAQILKSSPLSDEQLDFVETILLSGENLMVIINDILDLAKITADKVQLEARPFDLRVISEQAVDLFTGKALEKKLELILDFQAERQRFAVGDAGKIRQILTNMISNAIKFTDEGHVLVTVSHEKEQGAHEFLFEVEDTGIGLPEGDVAGLFEDFTQADMSSTRQYGGTGLGLAICKRLVTQMGGRIGASQRVGGGARFWFRVPLPLAEGVTPVPYPVPSVASTRVLIADENPETGRALHRLFELWGMRSSFVSSGEQAIDLLREAIRSSEPFDVIMVGRSLSDMDAARFSEQVTGMSGVTPKLVLMVSSAYGLREDDQVSEERFAAVISKPIHQSELLNLLTQLWSMRGSDESSVSRKDRRLPRATERFDLDILVVEDDPSNQRVAKQMLESLGCRTTVVSSGRECLKLLEEIDVDGIFMDLQMPGMSGFDTTEAIRALSTENKRNLPIVALTAHAMGVDRERALEKGMNGYITKPLRSADLVFALKTWMRSSGRL